jgi:hypothetical protein
MYKEILWLLSWPVFIVICFWLIQLFVKKYEKVEKSENEIID